MLATLAEHTWVSVRQLNMAVAQWSRAPLNVVRASVSRTLRRLWRDGLVEISDYYSWTTMSARRDREVAKFRDMESDPESAYQEYIYLLRKYGMEDTTSPDATALIERHRQSVQPDRRLPIRNLKAKYVEITPVGRERLTCLTLTKLTDTGLELSHCDSATPETRR